jgi:hypothetical protein
MNYRNMYIKQGGEIMEKKTPDEELIEISSQLDVVIQMIEGMKYIPGRRDKEIVGTIQNKFTKIEEEIKHKCKKIKKVMEIDFENATQNWTLYERQ